MKITAIYGSPKPNGSMSERLIEQIQLLIGEPVTTYQAIKLLKDAALPETLDNIMKADVLLIVFPLYVDNLPAPLIEVLTRLEQAAEFSDHKPMVYSICNCGFHEVKHNWFALSILRQFAKRAGLPYGYGLSVGAGPMMQTFKDFAKGPAAALYTALTEMAQAMRQGIEREDASVTAKFPRRLYIFIAHIGWNQAARQSGVRRQIRARPHIAS